MELILAIIASVLLIAVLIGQLLLIRRSPAAGANPTAALARLDALERAWDRTDRALRDEIAQGRQEAAAQARALRDELRIASEQARVEESTSLRLFNDSLLKNMALLNEVTERKLDEASTQARTLRVELRTASEQARLEEASSLRYFSDSLAKSFSVLNESTERKLETVRGTVEQRLIHLQSDNGAKLEEMRRTVDEKLQGTLEKRLSDSFRLVSERLEQVHKGLGEMQTLAADVGGLKKVLSNVRTRGTWGEMQLGALLEEILAPEQFARNVATTGRSERVEFAVRLPGNDPASQIWLPIDAKFPQEDYARLLEASERGDVAEVEACGKRLERRICDSACEIHEKYVEPPKTTDFAVMYLPTESLYAEVLRRPDLVESLQRDHRVTVAGPTTLAALLNSLRMGFRTLAIQKQSSEVWETLAIVKNEFGKYSDILEKLKKKLTEASNTVDSGLTRTRQIEKRLRDVEDGQPVQSGLSLLEPSFEEFEAPRAAIAGE